MLSQNPTRHRLQMVSVRIGGLAIVVSAVTMSAVIFAEDLRVVVPKPDTPVVNAAQTAPSPASPVTTAEMLLKDYGVEPTLKSMRAYLRSMLPDSNAEKRQQKLIRQLGDDDYHKRELAMKTLLRLPVVSSDLLKKAANGGDPEVRWRADRILKTATRRSSDVLNAALQVIAARNIRGLTAEVLGTMPHCTTAALQESAARALLATAVKTDVPLLRKSLHDKSRPRPVRIASLRALSAVLGKQVAQDLKRLSTDPDTVIKYESLRALIEQGNREALPGLVKLLESKELKVRVKSVQILRAVSGKRFAFVAYEDAKNRRTAVLKWRQWIASNGQTVAWKLPLKLSVVEIGHTLICDYSRNRVIELDAKGTIVWERPVGSQPWGCQGLPNGHRLVVSYGLRTVTEYDAGGKVVWAKTSLPGSPMGVQRLENGNTLIACSNSNKVIEVNKDGKTVWEVTIASRPSDAKRLENGNTLVCLRNSNRIVEVGRDKKVKWQINGVSRPFSVERLENGNTLVACTGSGSVIEYNRAGKSVWSHKGLRNPYDVQRLANGNTLIADYTGLIEVDRKGNVVWTYKMRYISRFHRF